VKDLEDLSKSSEVKVKESRAAKILHKKVQSMIKKMDVVVNQLEKGKSELESHVDEAETSEKK
jgi:LETM1 and EF-hand domain-containing protein 1